MQIDWITVAAQVANFLVLVWLLKHFLYKPVIDAMATREQRIANRMDDARQRERQAQAEAEAFREKSAALERERETRLEAAREAAERERLDLLEAARAEVESSRQRWQQELAREQQESRTTLVRELAESAVAIARRALAELADATLEQQVVAKLVRALATLTDEERDALAASAPRLRLATAFEPSPESLDALRGALSKTLGRDVELEAVRKPELVAGVELSGADHKVAWNVSDYLAGVADILRETVGSTPPPPANGQAAR